VLQAAIGATPAPLLTDALPRAEDALAIGLPRLQAGQGIAADVLAPAYLRNKVALTLDEQRTRRR
jgi:tRNA threonylcarbamoyladenosine biosynthesis protein TsaB